MATACQSVRIVADLTMQVPRDDTGDLDSGAEGVLARIDAVTRVDSVDVTNLRPRLNDLLVDATVTVAVDVDDARDPAAAGRDVLADGFGVDAVDHVQVDHTAAHGDLAVG